MSHPYSFSRDNIPASLYFKSPAAKLRESLTKRNRDPLPSFQKNVNRAKTKKWVEAPSYSYEGDDWGSYDEQDEYGVNGPSSQQSAPAPTGFWRQGQSTAIVGGRRSTTPVPKPTQAPHSALSFDVGDGRRAFSATPHPQEALVQVRTNVPAASAGSRDAPIIWEYRKGVGEEYPAGLGANSLATCYSGYDKFGYRIDGLIDRGGYGIVAKV